MGLEKRASIRKYFVKNEDSWIRKLNFGRDSWIYIFQALYHLSNDILSLIEYRLNENLSKIWIPEQRLTIDEMMHLFKGKSKHKIYDKSKPTKWGLKYYLAVDSSGSFWIFGGYGYDSAGNQGE